MKEASILKPSQKRQKKKAPIYHYTNVLLVFEFYSVDIGFQLLILEKILG